VGGPVEVLAQLDIGPHLLFAGRILCAPGGHGAEFPMPVPIAQECRGPAGFAAGVEAQLAAGAHLVKVALNGADGRVQLTDDELAAVVRTAHDAGAWVAAHASVNEAVAMAVRHGVDTIEHGNGLDRETAALALAQGITLVPTLCIFEELDPCLFPPDQQQEVRSAVEQRRRDHRTTLESARQVGLPLAFGTDRVPGGDVVAVKEEAHALQAHGLTAEEVLASATSGSAAGLGLSDRGRLAPGLRADIIVVPGDLAHDLSGLGSPELVLISPR
jgi:imidazolonepropionase-like amidohydrolase